MNSVEEIYRVPRDWLVRRIKVVVVGAGGTGSHVAAQLATLHMSMLALGHPYGLEVTVGDGDLVAEANIGRARYNVGDVGQAKAAILCHRINLSYGLDFDAVTEDLDEDSQCLRSADVIFGCVDTRASRRMLHAVVANDARWSEVIWIDAGNGSTDGQVFMAAAKRGKFSLPSVVDFYPEILDKQRDPVDPGPSCSMAEALVRQSCFVNLNAATHAVGMLSNLLRAGEIGYSGVYFDLKTGRSSPVEISLAAWKRMGYERAEEADAA